MKRIIATFLLTACAAYGAATPIANLAITTDANGRANSWTNLADVRLTNGTSLASLGASSGATGVVVNAFVTGATYNATTRQLTLTGNSGGGSGTFTNVTIGTNVMTAQAIIKGGSNISTRAAGGTNYLDGAAFSTLYSLANAGGLSISQASGPISTLTVTNSPLLGGLAASAFATGSFLRVASSPEGGTNYTGVLFTNQIVMGSARQDMVGNSVFSGLFMADDASDYSNILIGNTVDLGGDSPYWIGGFLSLLSGPSGLGEGTVGSMLVGQEGAFSEAWRVVGNPSVTAFVPQTHIRKIYGDGENITNVNAVSLNAIAGTNYVRGVVINGATNRPDSNGLAQLGTISGGGSGLTNIYPASWAFPMAFRATRHATTNSGCSYVPAYLDSGEASNSVAYGAFIVSATSTQEAFVGTSFPWPQDFAPATNAQINVLSRGNTTGTLTLWLSDGTNSTSFSIMPASADTRTAVNAPFAGTWLTNVNQGRIVRASIAASFLATNAFTPQAKGVEELLTIQR